jgi:hypothetical protein
MSTHPNAMLILALTPDDLARKTYRAILEEAGITEDDQIKVGGDDYSIQVMEEAYDESNQLAAKEGDIVLHDLVTYGYGETITWEKLEAQKRALEEWAKEVCERHKCSYQICVGANYW